MTDKTVTTPEPGSPQVVSRPRWAISLVWLVPLVAAVIGVSMLLHSWVSIGPEITVTFRTASELEAGKTQVRYRDVVVGAVEDISLSEDGTHVVVRITLDRDAERLTREDSRFWVVRPRIGAGGVSGFDTLFSGAYIAADAGASEETSRRFTGMENPPTVIGGTPGTAFILHARDLGSLDIGSPVFYRRIQVGRVASYQLADDGSDVNIQVFIDDPYDKFVTTNSRFWNASGVDVSFGAEGLQLKTQSMASVVAGGIAFATPRWEGAEPAPEKTEFDLEEDQRTAMAPRDGPPLYLRLYFDQALHGLGTDAPVRFSGIELGRVVSIDLDYDAEALRFPSVVGVVVYPDRLGEGVREQLPQMTDDDNRQQMAEFLRDMVAQGLRARGRTGNLLTGQLYISLEFVENAAPASFDVNARPLTLPTVRGDFEQLQDQVASIVAKVERMPLDAIGQNLNATLVNLNRTLESVNRDLLPETLDTLKQARRTFGLAEELVGEDAPLQHNLDQTLREVQRAARSLRSVTERLGENPEALLRGLPEDRPPRDFRPPRNADQLREDAP